MRRRPDSRRLVLPVAAERIAVSRSPMVTGGVEIRVDVETHAERVDLDLRREDVEVRRIPIDRPIAGPPPTQWWDGDELVLPMVEERLVVERRLFLREEVRIRRRMATDRHHEDIPRRVEVATVRRYRRTDSPHLPTHKGKKP